MMKELWVRPRHCANGKPLYPDSFSLRIVNLGCWIWIMGLKDYKSSYKSRGFKIRPFYILLECRNLTFHSFRKLGFPLIVKLLLCESGRISLCLLGCFVFACNFLRTKKFSKTVFQMYFLHFRQKFKREERQLFFGKSFSADELFLFNIKNLFSYFESFHYIVFHHFALWDQIFFCKKRFRCDNKLN